MSHELDDKNRVEGVWGIEVLYEKSKDVTYYFQKIKSHIYRKLH